MLAKKRKTPGSQSRMKNDPDAAGPSSQPSPSQEHTLRLTPTEARTLAQKLKEAELLGNRSCSRTHISQQEEANLVQAALRFLLFRHASRPGVPIPRSELGAALSAAREGAHLHQSVSQIVPLKARWLLASRFGILAREVTRSTKPVTLQSQVEDDAPASQAGTKQRYYVLESLVPARLAAAAPLDTGAGPRRALLIAVLSILHLAGGRVDQDELWHHLAELGVHKGDRHHPELGSVDECLELFVAQWYINVNKDRSGSGEGMTYSIGEHAASAFSGAIPEFLQGLLQEEEEPEDDCIMILDD
uniref:MAGE domain-containing protein n=2 Tax=Auxenochlorella protothecoides TaxID=3075 RepID=A0A1D2ABF3_AUXPR